MVCCCWFSYAGNRKSALSPVLDIYGCLGSEEKIDCEAFSFSQNNHIIGSLFFFPTLINLPYCCPLSSPFIPNCPLPPTYLLPSSCPFFPSSMEGCDPNLDHGFVFDDQGLVDMLHYSFFDTDFGKTTIPSRNTWIRFSSPLQPPSISVDLPFSGNSPSGRLSPLS
ncbi:hypothetical protein MA16_Dca021338 [Dendrobium catenatum]|uniref:Uncharacterized protein n=1 Tax=Dendrobium catenatum TaxID=906689 RepID=A0A2I0WWY4_9ASPA|nr:hypothetical protein MA16_Dca021338 [Dendrobium catenatum]